MALSRRSRMLEQRTPMRPDYSFVGKCLRYFFHLRMKNEVILFQVNSILRPLSSISKGSTRNDLIPRQLERSETGIPCDEGSRYREESHTPSTEEIIFRARLLCFSVMP